MSACIDAVVGPAAAAEGPAAAESRPVPGRWHARYEAACLRYGSLGVSAELLDAVAAGLREWAAILPQVETDRHGQHKKANSWGLGAELAALWQLEVVLDLGGDARLGAEIKRMARHLHRTAESLDACYPKVSADEEQAERRLVLICRIAAYGLADLLGRMQHRLFGVRKGAAAAPPPVAPLASAAPPAAPIRKRASRAAGIEALRRELIEHIKSARDHAHAGLQGDREPQLLPRPSKADLGRRTGLPRHTVSRCFADPAAQELRLLWRLADDLEAILRYGR